MGRLIDADKLKEAISKSTCHWTEHFWKQVVCDVIDNQPTAYDVEKVVAELEEKTEFLKDCTKYGNESVEQQEKSYSTVMLYEVADLVDDLIDIVRKGGISEPTENKEADTR